MCYTFANAESFQVENLFKKLESLPENLKRVAFNKIQEKLPLQDKLCKYRKNEMIT